MTLLSLLFSLQLELELIIQRTKLVQFADKRKLVIRVTYSNIIRVYARSAIHQYTIDSQFSATTSTIIRKVQQQAEVRLQFFKISKGQPGLIIISLQRPWGLHTKSHHHNSTTKPHHQPQIVNRNQKTPFYYSRPPLRPSFSDEDWLPLAGCGQFLNFIFVKCVKMLGANRNKHKLN